MTDVATIKSDDYARFHIDYHEDTDLVMIADELADQYGDAGSSLVWLYWPRMITAAKSAKSFGWFSATPRRLAQSIGDGIDGGAWEIRVRMWNLLATADIIRLRDASAVTTPSERLDVLIVEWEKWQVWGSAERKKLQRERERVAGGTPCHWTVAHLAEFCDTSHHVDNGKCDNTPEKCDTPSVARDTGTPNEGMSRHTTRHNTTGQEETRTPAAPSELPVLIEVSCGQAAAATGISVEWWVTSVQKLRQRNLSAPDDLFITSIDWIINELDGKQIDVRRAWSMLDGSVYSAVRRLKTAAPDGNTQINHSAMYAKLGTPGAAA